MAKKTQAERRRLKDAADAKAAAEAATQAPAKPEAPVVPEVPAPAPPAAPGQQEAPVAPELPDPNPGKGQSLGELAQDPKPDLKLAETDPPPVEEVPAEPLPDPSPGPAVAEKAPAVKTDVAVAPRPKSINLPMVPGLKYLVVASDGDFLRYLHSDFTALEMRYIGTDLLTAKQRPQPAPAPAEVPAEQE